MRKPLTEMTTQELSRLWDTIAMIADEYVHAHDGDVDEGYERQLRDIEAEFNSRGLGLTGTPYPDFTEKVTARGTTFLKFIKLWKTELGNAMWNVTNLTTGQGKGGFTRTLSEAHRAAALYIEPDERLWEDDDEGRPDRHQEDEITDHD
jgi:hypothetical protein